MTGTQLRALWCGLLAMAAISAQSFTGFTPGNLVVSRTVYTGDASVLSVGQPLPPVCPSTAVCGTTVATDSGAYPSVTSINNVWNNNKADGSFGITTPIFLDQVTPDGSLVSTLAIPSNLVTTSFSSKSELALNRSLDGGSLAFMGYIAPPNTVDVSNSNTPGAYDPTNPAGGMYFRAVVQVGADGAIQVTPTNSYSGNNGRAAIYANGLYYMVGNSNNGSGTPANVVAGAGVQMAVPGQTGATPPIPVGSFSITQLTDPATGQPYAADKLGKDNNFRGLTIFNNTLFVTKGSGGNGVNTVYQVGASGTLPPAETAATTPISILPGFPTVLAKNLGPADNYPFGIWFANATTLYVADEGNGVLADAVKSPSAGLQKWVLSKGTWSRVYVMQNGLQLGQPYSVPNYPASLNPATGGLRNLTGRVNPDGTVTLWAVTSTISANGDQGADPNKLVAITDVLTNTDPAAAAKQQFTTLRSAAAGELLRGVSMAPSGGIPVKNTPLIVAAANPGIPALAPGGLAFALGQGLAAGTPPEILGPSPTVYNGTSVTITDSTGKTVLAPLLYVTQWQLTFLIPATVAPGLAQVAVNSPAAPQQPVTVFMAAGSPGVFTVNGLGLAAAFASRVSNGAQTIQPAYAVNSFGSFSANPIDLGSATDLAYLTLYTSGLQGVPAGSLSVTVGGAKVPVLYAGPSGSTGVDQVNVQLPASLAGRGRVPVQISVDSTLANTVQITLK